MGALIFKEGGPKHYSFYFSFLAINSLRSCTEGRGIWSLVDSRFKPVPRELQIELVQQIRKRKGLKELHVEEEKE